MKTLPYQPDPFIPRLYTLQLSDLATPKQKLHPLPERKEQDNGRCKQAGVHKRQKHLQLR